MYTALGIDIQQVEDNSTVVLESEREVIKDSLLPSASNILQLLPQERISNLLGDNSGFLLANYLKVAEIIDEEVQVAVNGASSKSAIGELKQWDDGFSAAILHQSSAILQLAKQPTNYQIIVLRLKLAAVNVLLLKSFVMDGIQPLFLIHLLGMLPLLCG